MSEPSAIGKIAGAAEQRVGHGAPADFSAGDALIQPALNRISLHGRVTQVEPKVMQVLVLMAARPGAVVSRDTFLETVWAGTVGDDYLLNRAISELRKIFDDDPQAPRYVETIRKSGYRLIAPIAPARVAHAIPRPAGEPPPAATAPAASAAPGHVADPRRPPPARARSRLAALGLVLALGAAAVYLLATRTDDGPDLAERYQSHPLTSFVGRELEPALSPDGSRVAFIRDSGGAFDVQVKTIGSEEVLNLTASPASERHPLWSADGRSILFARPGVDGLSILRVSALGGGATRVHHDAAAAAIRGMSLSPDGERLVYAARAGADAPYRLVLAMLGTGDTRVVSNPPAGTLGDIDPRFARDGRSIVFVRSVNEVTKDLHRVAADGGEPVRLTFDNRKINGLAWSPGGDRLLFTSTRSGMYALWSADARGGDLRPVRLGQEDIHQPATAAGIDAIAFEQWMHRARLRWIPLDGGAEADAGGDLQSTRWDSNPAWSPDGGRIAFSSNRSGPQGIWVSRRDGSDAVQVAEFDGAFVDNPAWSPDGRLIAFDGSPDGASAIFTVSPEGGPPRRIVGGPGDSRNPAWSRDGAWLYFESNRSGEWRVHALPSGGGEVVAVSDGPARHPRESADGRHLLYSKPDAPGLWQRPRADWGDGASGRETRLVDDLAPRDGANWAPASAAIYYVQRPDEGPPRLLRFDPAGGAAAEVLALSPDFEGWGFDLSPDESQLVFSELVMRESDLRLALPR